MALWSGWLVWWVGTVVMIDAIQILKFERIVFSW